MKGTSIAAGLLMTFTTVGAQQGASFRLEEHVFNAAGHPVNGTILNAASHRIRLDSSGEGLLQAGLASVSFRMDAGFVSAYRPPGEVLSLRALDQTTFQWNPEKSVGTYALYRDLLTVLPALGYGDCQDSKLSVESASDVDLPPLGAGFFYLPTARNRLGEEGTKGFASSGAERGNLSPCP